MIMSFESAPCTSQGCAPTRTRMATNANIFHASAPSLNISSPLVKFAPTFTEGDESRG